MRFEEKFFLAEDLRHTWAFSYGYRMKMGVKDSSQQL